MEYAIKTEKLTKRFKSHTAVDQLDLKVPQGSIYAFLGPNGAGKTTTIKMLMNLVKPSSGSSTILGKSPESFKPQDFTRIGYVSENQVIPAWMRVDTFIDFCRKMYDNWDQAFAEQLIKQFQLPLDKKVGHLSRGVRMKLALVTSLAFKPELLILDEPFSGLDPTVREEFIDGILALTESEKWTIFITSHDIHEVERLADWVGMIGDGTLKVQEELEELQNRCQRVNITLSEPSKIDEHPPSWLLFEKEDRTVRFVTTQYKPGESEEMFKRYYGAIEHLEVQGMSLREIFLILAEHFKMLNI